MALTQYCELDEVRAALGVNETELTDAVLNLPIYQIGLVRELAKISASLPAAFLEVSALPESTRTEVQAVLFDAARMFSVYTCAKQVGASLGSLVPKDVSDGKASLSRFSDSPYRDTLKRVEEILQTSRADLVEAYARYTGTNRVKAAPAVVFRASGRGYDPVTGS